MNIPKTIIVMGRSGSGKGTQISLFKNFLKNNNIEFHHFESGNLFREMIKADGHTSERLREFLDAGKLVPDFLTDWLLVNNLVENIHGPEQVLILDGYPRTLHQIETLDATLDYYGRENSVVINIDVSEHEVRRRMKERGRGDDANMQAVENRINFYNQKVLPTIEKLREKNNYQVVDINGEGEIDDIQNSLKAALNIK